MGNITKVPNGPLIKKKGTFKGSTLKNGGPVQKVDPKKYLEESKKRVNKIVTPLRKAEIKKGIITYDDYLNSKIKDKKKNGGPIKKAQDGIKKDSIKTKNDSILAKQRKINLDALNKISDDFAKKQLEKRRLELYRNKPKSSFKAGGMIKRADGSMSRRGLWDNIRANKGSGKKPTAAMLKQEKKIKAKAKK